jgi:hypothetical protein
MANNLSETLTTSLQRSDYHFCCRIGEPHFKRILAEIQYARYDYGPKVLQTQVTVGVNFASTHNK